MDDDLHGLEKVIEELDKLMDDAIYASPYREYTGSERNKILKTLTDYMNTLSHKYQFQEKYRVRYSTLRYYNDVQLLDTDIRLDTDETHDKI